MIPEFYGPKYKIWIHKYVLCEAQNKIASKWRTQKKKKKKRKGGSKKGSCVKFRRVIDRISLPSPIVVLLFLCRQHNNNHNHFSLTASPMAASSCTVYRFFHLRALSPPNSSGIFSFPGGSRSNKSFSALRFSAKAAKSDSGANVSSDKRKEEKQQELEEEEVEEELPWIQEKALDLVEFTGSVTQALPGPRVGQTSFPWILTVPLAYFGITFVIAFVKTVRKFNSPREKRRKLVRLVTLSLFPCFIYYHCLSFTNYNSSWILCKWLGNHP